jgi:hypothetical protein
MRSCSPGLRLHETLSVSINYGGQGHGTESEVAVPLVHTSTNNIFWPLFLLPCDISQANDEICPHKSATIKKSALKNDPTYP